MICEACKKAADKGKFKLHKKCKGGTWCDCQHVKVTQPTQTVLLPK